MDTIKLHQLIKETSPTFCMAKFHEATIWLYNGKIASCHHNPFHDVGNTVETFYNTPVKREQQSLMLNGEKPDACGYCWKLEEQGLTSDRHIKSGNYPDHLDAVEYFYPATNFKPRVLELAFQKTCNLGCSYCNADFSSQWLNDIRVNGTYSNIFTDTRKHYQRPAEEYKESPVDLTLFWSWLDSVIDNIDIIRVTGGEPLLHEETFTLLDHVRSKNPLVKIAINSNMCQKPTVLERFVEKVKGIKNVSIYTSNESAGHVAEILRDGMDYQQWLNNVFTLDQAGLDHIFIMTTINSVSLQNFDQFLLDMSKLRTQMRTPITIDFNFLSYPEFQSFACLSQEALDHYSAKYSAFIQGKDHKLNITEVANYQRLLTRLNQPVAENQDKLAKDCYSFYQQFGQRRGKDISKLELFEFIG